MHSSSQNAHRHERRIKNRRCVELSGDTRMPTSLPSSFGKAVATRDIAPPSSMASHPEMPHISASNIPTILAAVALLLSLVSLYGVFFMDHPIGPMQKAELLGIASDLRSLEQRDITMTAPVTTTILMNKSYPLKDVFPATFEIPLEFEIPLDTNLLAIGPNGQPFSARIQESIPVKVVVPISSEQAFGATAISFKKELPVDATFSTSVKIGATYGQELGSIVERLENLAGEKPGASSK